MEIKGILVSLLAPFEVMEVKNYWETPLPLSVALMDVFISLVRCNAMCCFLQ